MPMSIHRNQRRRLAIPKPSPQSPVADPRTHLAQPHRAHASTAPLLMSRLQPSLPVLAPLITSLHRQSSAIDPDRVGVSSSRRRSCIQPVTAGDPICPS
ncbi:hypothetical protein M0R45_029961 [Rubus argutus]|uniref:Uncharacterized protein n=1 Tax=Rubus argutus TaxID=59490 RepID=A0AAW1WDV1_RUBAR